MPFQINYLMFEFNSFVVESNSTFFCYNNHYEISNSKIIPTKKSA